MFRSHWYISISDVWLCIERSQDFRTPNLQKKKTKSDIINLSNIFLYQESVFGPEWTLCRETNRNFHDMFYSIATRNFTSNAKNLQHKKMKWNKIPPKPESANTMTAFHTMAARNSPRKRRRLNHQITRSQVRTRRLRRTTMPRRRPTTAPLMWDT